MMVQENPIELEKVMTWSRRSKSRWRVSFSGDWSFLFRRSM